MLIALRVFLAAGLITFASWLSGRKPVLAGFIIALPLTSLLSLAFSYYEYRDMDKLNLYARSILTAVPLSLVFFVPFLLNKWLKMGFAATMFSAIGLLVIAYFMHTALFRSA